MRVLVGCEESGTVAQAFRDVGHDAWSADLVRSRLCLNPAHTSGAGDCCGHYIGDVRELLQPGAWDLLIAHPPCTYLCLASVWAFDRTPPHPRPGVLYGAARRAAMEEAATFFRTLLNAPVPQVCLENPTMHGRAGLPPPTQYVQPYQFGDDASKRTGLWLRGLPKLIVPHEEQWIAPRMVDGRPRWGNQTDSGQNKLPPSATRARDRAVTYPGIARAMAAQWGARRP